MLSNHTVAAATQALKQHRASLVVAKQRQAVAKDELDAANNAVEEYEEAIAGLKNDLGVTDEEPTAAAE